VRAALPRRGRFGRQGPGRYNLYLGAAFDGSRLSKLYAEDLEHDAIVNALDPLFASYATDRNAANVSAISSSARGSSPRPPTAETSMPRRTTPCSLK